MFSFKMFSDVQLKDFLFEKYEDPKKWMIFLSIFGDNVVFYVHLVHTV